MVTVKTTAAPATNVCAHASADTSRSERSEPMTRKPAIASARKRVGGSSASESGDSDSCGGIVSRAIISADQTKLAALITNSTGTPVTTSSSPAMAGPMKKARLSSVLLIAFAAVSSCGELASRGSSAASAGRNGPPMKPTITARVTTTSGGPSSQIKTAAISTRPARSRSVVIRNAFLGHRSTSVVRNGSPRAISSNRATAYPPTYAAPPCW